ncbi:hypothetical protein [Streptomyces sp. NPDC001380]|uniref:hypothetical protein n=1 Tax=Streptomyces sp. NPDC001380 TaxID=3364566 RepID=UPI0036CB748B
MSTGPGRDPGPARTVAPAAPAAPSPLPAAGAGTSVERYGVAEGDPGAQPTGRRADEAGGGPATAGDPHGSEAAGRGRGAEARPSHLRRLRPQRRAAGRHGAHGGTHHGRRPGPHTGGRHTGGRGGVCDLGTRFGRWAPGSAAERTCRQVYG